MAEPKKPQDHKPKTEKPKVTEADGVYTVTHEGITVNVPQDAFDDFELLDDLAEVESGNALRLPSMLRRLVGDDYRRVLDELRDKGTGRVRIERGAEFAGEVLKAINPNS